MEVQPIVDFTWEAFLNERICVDFETKENSNLFFSECIKRGIVWLSGDEIKVPAHNTKGDEIKVPAHNTKIVCYRYENRIGWACNRLPLAYYSYKPDTVVELI